MNGKGYYVITKDPEISAAGKTISNILNLAENAIKQYRGSVTSIYESSIPSGRVHDALVVYGSYIEKLEEIVRELGPKCKRLTNSYIRKIDDADNYLYDSGTYKTRKFDQEQYDLLLKCLDDPLCDFTDSIGDWVYGKAKGGLNALDKFFDTVGIKNNLYNTHKLLLDYNDETRQGLTLIFNEVHDVDVAFGGTASNSSGYLGQIVDTTDKIIDLITEMANIISPKSKVAFTADNVQKFVGGKYDILRKCFDKVMAVPEPDERPSLNVISDFVNQPWSRTYFSGFMGAWNMFLSDIGIKQEAGMVIFNMFDIFKEQISPGVNFSYDEFSRRRSKEQLLALLEEVGKTRQLYIGSNEEDSIEEAKIFLKYVKKYGKKIYDWMNKHRLDNGKLILDGRTVEARKFREFLDSVGGAGNILKYGDEGLEYLSRLFADYSAAIDVLDSVGKNVVNDPEMQQNLEEIRALFNKKFGAWTIEFLEQAWDLGYDAVMDKLAEGVPVLAVVTAIREVLDIGGEITGLGTHSKAYLDAMSCYDVYCSSQQAYDLSVQKIRDAIAKGMAQDSEEYQELCQDSYNCFELTRLNLQKTFNEMEKATSGMKAAYYRYCAKQAGKISMNDTQVPDIMSYEEFCRFS